jgi:transcriptional regulator with XRE-family HTH domain
VSLQSFVRELHRKRGLSQTAIARKSSLSQGAIYKILAGIGNAQLTTFQKLAAAYPDEWGDYVRRHPAFRKQLNDMFRRMIPLGEGASESLPENVKPRDVEERLSRLAARLRERYHERVRDLSARTARELEEFLELLEAEDRQGDR